MTEHSSSLPFSQVPSLSPSPIKAKGEVSFARGQVHHHTEVKKTHSPVSDIQLGDHGRSQWPTGMLPGFMGIYTYALPGEMGPMHF